MTIVRKLALGASFFVVLGTEIVGESPLKLGLFSDAHAVIGPAPGGSVVRRRAVVGTAAVASSSANASAAAAANANAAAASANAAAAAAKPPAPDGPLPVGTMVTGGSG